MWGTCSVRLREKIEISETFGEKGEGELANSSLGRRAETDPAGPGRQGVGRGPACQGGAGSPAPRAPAAVSTLVHEGGRPQPVCLADPRRTRDFTA